MGSRHGYNAGVGSEMASSDILTERDFTCDYAQQLIESHGGEKERAAKAVYKRCRGKRGQIISWATVVKWLNHAIDPNKILTNPDDDKLNHLRKMIEGAGIDVFDIGRIDKAKVYQGQMKGPDGKPIVSTMASLHLDPTWKDGPKFPVIQQAKPTKVVFAPGSEPRLGHKLSSHVWISDMQGGFLRHVVTHQLDPMHDPRACDLTEQIIGAVQPVVIGQIGDLLDNQQFSRFEQHPEFDRTTQPSLDAVHMWLARWRAAGGKGLKRYLVKAGNHDIRFEKYLLTHAKAALGLRRAATPPDSWPVFSMPYMLRFEDLGIEYLGGFPGGEFWILDDLVIMHEPPKKLEFAGSVIHGHTHHITRTQTPVTHERTGNRKVHWVYDIGCICRTDATIDPRRLLRTNVPSDRGRTDWCQGIAVVNIIEGKIPVHQVAQVEMLESDDGLYAQYGGKRFLSRLGMKDPFISEAA